MLTLFITMPFLGQSPGQATRCLRLESGDAELGIAASAAVCAAVSSHYPASICLPASAVYCPPGGEPQMHKHWDFTIPCGAAEAARREATRALCVLVPGGKDWEADNAAG